MVYLVDTCVLSEGAEREINPSVEAWFVSVLEEERFVSVISLAEIHYGILRLSRGHRRTELAIWYEDTLRPSLGTRVVAFGEVEAVIWASLRARYPNAHHSDAQIAATAIAHNLTLVTRNVKDFAFEGLSVVNPWEYEC
jgi:toxin FitB